MGLVNFVISTVGKCLDALCLLLDLNFVIVHTVVQTLLAVITFITSLPSLLYNSVLELGNLVLLCAVSSAEATSNLAHSTVANLGSLLLALEGLLESLKMVGYLSMHVLLRGKEHLCRGLLSVIEGCGIAVSLVVYFTNTVVNFVLIATQNVYLALVSMWQTVSTPLQKALELTLTCFTFLYSSLAGTSALLWTPCKMVLDFLVSLVHMFISIFILNIYGLVLTITIALATTAYLNPGLSRQIAYLQRILYHIYRLERRLWQQLSHQSGLIGLMLRPHLHRQNSNSNNRAGGDGDPGEERRDPPDGRAGDGAHQEVLNPVLPSSSTDKQLKKKSRSGEDGKPLPAESLLTLLKEQEERKKCVICQDCAKTVVLLPCRHLCLCRDCTQILLRQPIYQQNCPLCRQMILNTMDVYL
uniref:E3 ubiquitin-protein ligase RNF26 n=1 Tax=Pundamilia nyererei TaxID=303518 RepID=A0A3B4GM97_9CICH